MLTLLQAQHELPEPVPQRRILHHCPLSSAGGCIDCHASLRRWGSRRQQPLREEEAAAIPPGDVIAFEGLRQSWLGLSVIDVLARRLCATYTNRHGSDLL